MRKIGLLLAAVLLFGIQGHAFAGGAADPVCVTPSTISAADQADLDAVFPGYKSVVVATLTGDAAKNLGAMLVANGAPDYARQADTLVVLNALPPAGGPPMRNRHIVAFKDGCKIGGGFADADALAKLLGDPA